MRIAVLNWRDEVHPEGGGAELIVHELSERWQQWGHEVHLVTSMDPGLEAVTTSRGVPHSRIGRVRSFTHHVRAPRVAVAKDKPDVILESVNTFPYMLPLRGRNYPQVVTLVHQLALDVWNAHLPRPLARVAAAVEPQLYRPYRQIPALAYSRSTADDLTKLGISNVSVVPQGGNGPQDIGIKASDLTLVFAARLAANKRPDHAVEAFKIIKRKRPNARLVILGDGEMMGELKRTAPAGVELRGKLPREEVLREMGQSHVLVATSIREGWGLVVTEANSVGTPAVTYNVNGLRDSVRPGQTGVLTDTNPQALAAGVLELIEDQDRYERLRRQAILWGSGQSWDKMASSVLTHMATAAGVDPRSVDGTDLVDIRSAEQPVDLRSRAGDTSVQQQTQKVTGK